MYSKSLSSYNTAMEVFPILFFDVCESGPIKSAMEKS